MKPTQEQLRQLFGYDEKTGVLSWLDWHGMPNKRFPPGVAGSIGKRGYLTVWCLGRRRYVHRIIWCWMTGEWVDEIDHRDRIKINNSWINLRKATRTQNQGNYDLRSDNTTGYRGVYFHKKEAACGRKPWHVRLGGKHLGTFWTVEEAIAVATSARQNYFGDFACQYTL